MKHSQARNSQSVRRTLLLVTAGIVIAGVAVAVIVAARPGASPVSAPATTLPASSAKDPLTAAADALGFRPTTLADVGVVENLPPNTPLLAPSKSVLPVGAAAPDFTLSTATGEKVHLSDYRGKTVLLEFFATWCPHCQAEAKHLTR
ncbi:MAG: redoxin domain-containing protein, partial [Spirochaetia bacterium]